jgi:hypothetical protein
MAEINPFENFLRSFIEAEEEVVGKIKWGSAGGGGVEHSRRKGDKPDKGAKGAGHSNAAPKPEGGHH